jgi:hypothetical protein
VEIRAGAELSSDANSLRADDDAAGCKSRNGLGSILMLLVWLSVDLPLRCALLCTEESDEMMVIAKRHFFPRGKCGCVAEERQENGRRQSPELPFRGLLRRVSRYPRLDVKRAVKRDAPREKKRTL